MEFQGRIAKVLPMRQGTSTRTGNEWYAQPFVFEYFENPTDRFADSVVLETFNTDIMPHLKEGLEVICGFGHKAKTVTKQDGTQVTINEMKLYKFESVQHANKAAGAANAPAAEQSPTPQPNGAQAPQNDANDDLPF